MVYTYWLPDEQGQRKKYVTSVNSVVIIGANGSGKSKLGAWIERQSFEEVHRIGAQRNLNFNENLTLKSYSQAEDLVFYGTTNTGSKNNKQVRWDYGKYTTKLMDDFENVLAALIALKNNENDAFIESCRKAEAESQPKPKVPLTAIDRLQSIWNEVFPQRQLCVSDSKFYATFNKDGKEEKYSATQMSDGERSVLYLVAQVLCVPQNKVLIIDEPEIHLHRSIMNRLWSTLERYRPDCLFIYITHDTEFAALHSYADKIWIKEFDGTHWKLEQITDAELPEDLLLGILGSRKNVLFVEGEKNSYDMQLYSELYPEYHIIPCGSCSRVIAYTKAFGNCPVLHQCKVFGVIDRDYRSDYEIEKLKKDNIFPLAVAEVENLFLVEELLRLVSNHLGKDSDIIFSKVKDYIIKTRFKQQFNSQVRQSAVAEIKYRLTTSEISKKNDNDLKASLDSLFNSLDYESVIAEQEVKFRNALDSENYAAVLSLFNEKNLSKSIGHYLGLQDNAYCPMIIALLHSSKREEITAVLAGYLPSEISRSLSNKHEL